MFVIFYLKGENMFIAKKDEATGNLMMLIDHLNGVAGLSKEFAEDFKLCNQAFVLGYLHDLGKYSKEFQRYVNGENIIIDHSLAGAKELIHRFYRDKDLYPISKMLGMVITGHHGGLLDLGSNMDIDNGSHEAKLKRDAKNYYKGFGEIDESLIKIHYEEINSKLKITKDNKNKQDKKALGFIWQMMIRMLYSCVVDANFIDNERFLGLFGKGIYKPIKKMIMDFDDFMIKFSKDKKKNSNVNILEKRNEIFKKSMEAANNNRGLFTLTAPSGAGKTMAALAFSLKHMLRNDLKRVIYVVPYTSIVDDIAENFKKMIGSINVLEHQCDFVLSDENIEHDYLKYDHATENWDIPIVVTTNTKFFESCFSNKSLILRKIHNISNSVIIFDEIQSIPMGYLNPCIAVLNELMTNYNSSIVLSSSTCSNFYEYFHEDIKKKKVDIVNYKDYDEVFNRTKLSYLGEQDDDYIIKKLKEHRSALCIVNTRKHAVEIYKKIKQEENVFCLSTLSTPSDRKEKIKTIYDLLKNDKKCIVISTQIVEAYMDLDFQYVYKSVSSIDSIIQAAGRCNREGLFNIGEVFVFSPSSEDAKLNNDLKNTAKYGEEILKEFGSNSLSSTAIDKYFKTKHDLEFHENKLDKKNILDNFMIERQLKLNFKACSKDFKMLESNAYDVIIGQAPEDLINKLKEGIISRESIRQISDYTVSIYEYEFKMLYNNDCIEIINELIFLKNLELYDDEIGLNIFDDSPSESYIL